MKKYIFFLTSLFIILLVCFIKLLLVNARYKSITIVIDPGHGGVDPGTTYKDIYEKDINLMIAKKLKYELDLIGINVLLTRNGDYDLANDNALYRKKSDFDNRIKLINSSHVDLYLSIHVNYLNDSAYYGPQVFYIGDNFLVANIFQSNLNKLSGSNRVIKKIPNELYMYKKINIEGLLIECGFLSNEKERNLLISDNYQWTLADALKRSILEYFTINQ